jgi:hypothetical protein
MCDEKRLSGQNANDAKGDRDLSRRKFIQSTAWATGSSLFFQSVLANAFNGPQVDVTNARHFSGERIAATPAFKYRAYQSKASQLPETTSWLQIDLKAAQRIEAVRLYPANQTTIPGKDAYYVGEGFPVRFRIEASNDADFRQADTLIDQTAADFVNPEDQILDFPAKAITARYVRLTVTKFPKPLYSRRDGGAVDFDAPASVPDCAAEGAYWFALSKIGVLSQGRDIAIAHEVSSDTMYCNGADLAQLTRPERIEGEYVRRDHRLAVTNAASWKRTPYAAVVPLSGVKLRGGVFETAMRNNISYLIDSFMVDDLLLQFRERAGKPIPPSSHKPDSFWETDLAGSNAARFLMGAGNTLRWIDDSELRSRFEAVVNGIAECRQTNGYIMAYPEDTMFYSERGGYTRAWLTHGLIEAGYAGNAKAFELLRGNYDWFDRCNDLPYLMRGGVQGGQGMIGNTRMYFTPVGKPMDIQVIQRYFLEDKWLEALARGEEEQIWQYPYDRPHCYLLTNLEAYLDLYRATGDRRLYDGVKAAWEMYNAHWEQPGGSISIIEYSYDPPNSNSLTQKLGELCGSSFWSFLSQRFQLMDPTEERYAAEIEKSIYNVALANQDGSYGLRYHAVLVGQKEKGTRVNSCCEGQGTRLIGSLPEHIYSIAPDGIYVNLFEPSTLEWQHGAQDISAHMETQFPFANQVKLTISTASPAQMKLRVRVPSWSTKEMAVTVNTTAPTIGQPGTYLTLDRIWADGDVVSFTLPAAFSLKEYTGVNQIPGSKRYSLTYGPLLYAAVGSKDAVLRVTEGRDAEDLLQQLKPKSEAPLHYTVEGNANIILMPYWQVDKEEFTCFPVIHIHDSDVKA